MARDTLTGSRIRERRVSVGMKQAELARKAGISASYLNLIEHNRRRIGGKLLNDIAAALRTEPALLAEGAGAAVIAALREAAAASPGAPAELDRVDEFTGRFPGWAQLLAQSRERIAALERTVETLTDRISHDPHLATSLHEMLSTVTAIRSTAAILADPEGVDPDWQARFHRNLDQDSARLADTSRALVTYLEADGDTIRDVGSPQEEADAAWDAVSHTVPMLEMGGAVDDALDAMGAGLSDGARAILSAQLTRYAADAAQLPLDRLADAAIAHGSDPACLAAETGIDAAVIMRRLAALPPDVLGYPVGLVICDASGVPRYRKPLPGFPIPRVGAGCPLWPLYRALSRPFALLSGPIRTVGGEGPALWTDALAVPRGGPAVNRDPVFDAQMIVRPVPSNTDVTDPTEVGSSCRICPSSACPSRREPSILAGAAGPGGALVF